MKKNDPKKGLKKPEARVRILDARAQIQGPLAHSNDTVTSYSLV